MKGIKILLLVSLLFGVSAIHATVTAKPQTEISKQSYYVPAPAFVKTESFQIVPAMIYDVPVIERVDNEVLTIHPVNVAVADVSFPVMEVAHGPPRVIS